MTNDDELREWLDLFHLPTLSTGLYLRLLHSLKTPRAILEADGATLASLGVTSSMSREMHNCGATPDVKRKTAAVLEWRRASGHHVITLADFCYPPLLREVPDPPPLLFVCGKPESLLIPQIAIVGSRRCSVDGREVSASLAKDLARRGFSVCSGLALGIDSAAHSAAISSGGVTTAVQGTGIDIVYPLSNRRLATSIQEKGALLSELPLGSAAKSGHFPRRNRIISGMSVGVIVVEAALQSGSLITARLAMEQNREVFAVPGSVRNPLSRGTHRLIRDGVTLIETSDEVLEQLGSLMERHISMLRKIESPGTLIIADSEEDPVPLTDTQCKVLGAVGYDPASVDSLVDRTGLAAAEVQSALLALELNEQVHCDAGRYTLCGASSGRLLATAKRLL